MKQADGFARHALDHVARNREIIVCGARPSMVARLTRFVPAAAAWVGTREYRAERQRQHAHR